MEPDQAVLVAHAHPDDESAANAETTARLVEAGITVYTVTAADGERSTKGDPHFVTAGRRREEGIAAYESLGVPRECQYYLGLPDGQLSRPVQRLRLTQQFGTLMLRHDIDSVLTPGAEGFDGHPDHIAVHETALLASGLLRLLGKDIAAWALQADGAGELAVPVDRERKYAALAHHHSQFSQDPDVRDQQLQPYQHLFEHETYSRTSWSREAFSALPLLKRWLPARAE
jgi:LmbE family N-acetylglucosaminyl deacetylase